MASQEAINANAFVTSSISHELLHTLIEDRGDDGGEHFDDTDGDDVPIEFNDDWPRLMWNYNHVYGMKTTTGAIPAGPVAIPLNDTVGLPPRGMALIEGERIRYSGITAHALTGVIRAYGGTADVPHMNGVGVTIIDYQFDAYRQIRYGLGVTKHIKVR